MDLTTQIQVLINLNKRITEENENLRKVSFISKLNNEITRIKKMHSDELKYNDRKMNKILKINQELNYIIDRDNPILCDKSTQTD